MIDIISYTKVGEDDIAGCPILLVRVLKDNETLLYVTCVQRGFFEKIDEVKKKILFDSIWNSVWNSKNIISIEEALVKYKDTSVMLPFLREQRINKILND